MLYNASFPKLLDHGIIKGDIKLVYHNCINAVMYINLDKMEEQQVIQGLFLNVVNPI